jgi:hypothetical protein
MIAGAEILKTPPDKPADCRVTSPPYYTPRDYGIEGQIGLEETPVFCCRQVWLCFCLPPYAFAPRFLS